MTEHDPPPSSTRILLVEDEPAIREILETALAEADRTVHAVSSGEAALETLATAAYDLVILDLGLPGISGLETLQALRSRGDDTPVIVATAASSLDERLTAFDLGADDYVLKPLSVPELQRRVAAVLRRAHGPKRFGAQLLGPAGVVLDIGAQLAHVGARNVRLTAKQFDVLRFLLERRGTVVTPEEISVAVWGYGTFGSPNFVEAQISRIRARLTDAGAREVIETSRGAGYVIR
ncbi:MAG: response regulator transcription factor [Dehalococcoidia bacterium]